MEDFLHSRSVRTKTLRMDVLCRYVIVHAHVDTEQSTKNIWKAMRDECGEA